MKFVEVEDRSSPRDDTPKEEEERREEARRQKEDREKRAETEARHALEIVVGKADVQKIEAVHAAVDLLNDEKNRVVARAAVEPQKQKAEQIIVAVQTAPSLQATLRNLKELKAPLRALRVQQTLQELLVTGCYQDLLENEEEKKEALDGDSPEAPSLPTIEKMMKLIEKRLDEQEKSNTSKHLEDYIATWSQSQQKKSKQEIDSEANLMRNNWRHKTHSQIENIGFGIEFFQKALSQNKLLQNLDQYQKESELKAHVETIHDYLCDIIGESATTDYINKKGLDSSLINIQKEIARRTEEFVQCNESAWKFSVNAKIIAQDVKRRETLTNALLLGEESMAKEHMNQIEELIKTATQPVPPDQTELILPQLVEARIPHQDPNVRLEIVFDPSLKQEDKKKALQELERLLPGPSEMCDRPIIKSKQATVHKDFCANKDKLARLGVRVVLMGEYGLDAMKVKSRPNSNKIYSQSGLEKAEGFISTGYFEEKRGQETYYAPIGWRRVAVDVSLDEEGFWDLYINLFY